jgi:hypothetical protein
MKNLRRLIQKQNLQVNLTLLVKIPPRGGPAILAIALILASKDRYREIRLNGTACPMIVIPPEYKEAAPRPATALPTIKAPDDGALAHMTEPASNINREPIKTIFLLKKL